MKKAFFLFLLAILTSQTVRAQYLYTREVENAETWMQYAPSVLDFTMGFTNVKTNTTWLERAIKLGVSYAAEMALVNIIKASVKERRPDGAAMNSFPSGHTATAFLGAELIRQDYGWGWGAGAYALATGVGIMRVYHQRHWWWDVLAGAGVGILSANIGNWVLKPIEDLVNYHPHENRTQLSLCPAADPVSGTVGASLTVRF